MEQPQLDTSKIANEQDPKGGQTAKNRAEPRDPNRLIDNNNAQKTKTHNFESLAQLNDANGVLETPQQFDKTQTDSDTQKGLVPWIWTSLALLCGFLLVIGSEMRMIISHFHFNAIYLQAPGTFITNFIFFALISRNAAVKNREAQGSVDSNDDWGTSGCEGQLLNHTVQNQNKAEWFSFSWLKDIFYERIGSESTVSDSPNKYKLNTTKFVVFLMQIGLNVLVFWLQIESFYYAGQCKENIGVVLSLFAIKPIISFVLFYFALGYTINWIQAVGMTIAIIAAFIISISKVNFGLFEEHSKEDNINFLISVLLMVPVVCLICFRNLLFKLFYKSADGYDEVFVVQIQINFILSSVMLATGIVMLVFFNFRFQISDLMYGMVGGILNLICSVLAVIVVVKGHPGPADALVETSSIFITIIEAVIFFRVPNLLQYIGIALSFISTGFIIFGNHL